MINQIPKRIGGIIITLFLISFIVVSIQYWANVLIQEARGNIGAISFWTGLMLILIFKVNYWFIEGTNMIFYPERTGFKE